MSSSISDETAVLTLEVELVANVPGQAEESGTPSGGGFFGTGGGGKQTEEQKKALELVQEIDNKGIKNIKNMANNPERFMENGLMSVIQKAGPYGALAAAIITTILGAPELYKGIIQALGVKGGLFNQDYRFTQDEYLDQTFDRNVQFRRITGDDPLITVDTIGFVAGDPDFLGNSLIDANQARTARISLQESSFGYEHGI